MLSISILMANYNNGRYIKEAITSVVNQVSDNWELAIIDDCSNDNSVAAIKPFLQDRRIKLHQNERNSGYIASLRKLIELSRAEILGILDSDDALDKNAVLEIKRAYFNNPNAAMVYSQYYCCDESLECKHFGFSGPIPKGRSNLHLNIAHHFKTFRKSAYHKTAGYDNKCLFSEDIDLNLKLEEVGKLVFVDKPLYYYRVLPRSQTHSFRNTRINRSSSALAKLNAYKRRLGTDIPNLNKAEISEVLFWGIINAFLALRWKLVLQLKLNLLRIHPLFFLDFRFYRTVIKKIKKLKKLKQEKTLLKI